MLIDAARVLFRLGHMKEAQKVRIRHYGEAVAFATSAQKVAALAQDARTIELEQAKIDAFAEAMSMFGVDPSD